MDFFTTLFTLFITPLETLLRGLLIAFFHATGNYGLSILLLSLAVNVLLLPFYYLAEELKKKHRRKVDALQPQVRYFKRLARGQERQSYVAAVYRLAGYHPFSAVGASLGLLLQLPFFIAAYYFLRSYAPLQGVSFGVIGDLSAADGLLFGLNALPFLMTAVNLVAASFYTRTTSVITRSDKWQLWSLSAVFFVLLYREGAGLLLYWTMNNVFSLVKNLVQQHFKFRFVRSSLFNRLFSSAKKVMRFSASYWLLFSFLLFSYNPLTFYANNFHLLHFDFTVPLFTLLQFLLFFIFLLLLQQFLPLKVLLCSAVSLAIFYLLLSNFKSVLGLGGLTFLKTALLNYFSSPKIAIVLLVFFVASFATFILLRLRLLQKNVILLFLFLVNFSAVFLWVKKANQPLSVFSPQAISKPFQITNNVYFLLPDAYSGYYALREADLFDNQAFYNALERLGFTTYPAAFANYSRTFPSMDAIWNMEHNALKGVSPFTTRVTNQQLVFTGCNKVMKTFSRNGYEVFNNTAAALATISCSEYLKENYTFKAHEPREDLEFYFLYLGVEFLTAYYKKAKATLGWQGASELNYKHFFEARLKQIDLKPQLQFIYMHSLGTVAPALCNEAHLADQLHTKGYLRQVQCVSDDLLKALEIIFQHESDPLIIVMADHASVWRSSFASGQQAVAPMNTFNILQAFRWPQECRSLRAVKHITPVNTFRYVFACLLQDNALIAPDQLKKADSFNWGQYFRIHNYNKPDGTPYQGEVYKVIEDGRILEEFLEVGTEEEGE